MDVKGQVSAEYLLLALVFLIIIGSVTVPLVGKSIDSSNDISDTSNVDAAINTITNAIGVVYANGPGAKRTLNVYFPTDGQLTYNNKNLQMPVTLSNGTSKTISSSVPYDVTLSTNTISRGNYNVTITWPTSQSSINVALTSTT
ncbi:hypothetical protein [Methanobacterium spitsbergense]|uniref:Class III signal peptide-containing protein n=1 Tax=Methanobacterium spitsbergense TaxID=2874285 RepID=A0A8T5UNJ3_9EURY|nr:hypothetical protein [Methanobacterium spitsbergense]MBZ2165388.1 hypothetical protein [Methanobacterium spitsbergense]